MKSYCLKMILCCIAVFSTLNLKAQYIDYVIMNNGDTIHCTISSRFVGTGEYKNALMKKAATLNTGNKGILYSKHIFIM